MCVAGAVSPGSLCDRKIMATRLCMAGIEGARLRNAGRRMGTAALACVVFLFAVLFVSKMFSWDVNK